MSGVGSFNPRAGQSASPANQQGNVSAAGINQGGRQGAKSDTGPLKDLSTDRYKQNFSTYPEDLSSQDTAAHIMSFSIYRTRGSESPPQGDQVTTSVSGGTALKSGMQGFFQPARDYIGGGVTLYVPDSVMLSQTATYSEISLLDAIKEAGSAVSKAFEGSVGLGKVIGSIGSVASGAVDVVQSSSAKLGLSAAGIAINPRKQVIFEGIEFRTFTFSFLFTPRNEGESNLARSIVNQFRYAAAPSIIPWSGGFAWNPPDAVSISFLYRDANGNISPNPYLFNITQSVIENVEVNYAPNGIFSAFSNGAPTQIQLTLTIKELELIDKGMIGSGY